MTEREAFEAYAADSIPDYQSPKPYTAAGVESNVRAEAWAAWQAACAWQREQDAKVCEAVSAKHLSSGRYVSVAADHSVRAGGQVDGADECAAAIRAQGER